MTFLEAMKALSEGKRVRVGTWIRGFYIYAAGVNIFWQDKTRLVDILKEWITDVWEIYEEPKKKKRYWIWSLNDGDQWWKEAAYYDDGGIGTNGHKVYVQWDSMEKIKHENEFIEV